MELYHITNKRNIDSIMKNGLEPRIGYHSKGIESDPVLCLTEKEYIPFWEILLGMKNKVILKIDQSPDDITEIIYHDYVEARTNTVIPPDHISIIKHKTPRNEQHDAMRKLCLSRIGTFSWLCQSCARLYTNGVRKTMTHKEITDFLKSEYAILKHLDFSTLTLDEKRKYLKEFGESGEFTFLDQYLDTDKKLYQLSMYNDPYTYEIRHKIEDLITNAFDGCLDMCTGGWIYVQ